jgi:hypothetical protein
MPPPGTPPGRQAKRSRSKSPSRRQNPDPPPDSQGLIALALIRACERRDRPQEIDERSPRRLELSAARRDGTGTHRPHPHFFPRGNEGARIVKRTFLTVAVCLAAIAFLALALADREMQAGIRRLTNYRFPPRSALEADPRVNAMARAEPGPFPPRADLT